MKNYFSKNLFFCGLLAFNLATKAEDIDLFVGVPAVATDLPNLMMVIDNAASFSANAPGAGGTCTIDGATNSLSGTSGGIEQCALYTVIAGLEPLAASADTPKLNIGIMMYDASNIRDMNGANCGNSIGGCLVVPLMPLNKANKILLLAWIKSWRTSGGAGAGYVKANGQATASAMQETWAYYAGRTGISGRNYAGIKPVSGCAKNYVTFIGNSYSNSGSPGDASADPQGALEGTHSTVLARAFPAATTLQKALLLNGVSTDYTSTLGFKCDTGSYTFTSSNHNNSGRYADEWARYMASQNVTTFTIGVLSSACKAEYAALLSNMADVGGGEYFPTNNFTQLVAALHNILSQIQSVNSVFASVSLPVSVNTQGTYINQVYVGMFRPDQYVYPRWFGNLKQYKLGVTNGVLKLQDADSASAISSAGTGFIDVCARSFWTPTVDDTYWSLNDTVTCIGHAATSNTPDGNLVEKGGQAYTVRSLSAPVTNRIIKTCDNTTCTTFTSFNDANAAITKTLLGNASMLSADRTNLINWAIGLNNKRSSEADEAIVAVTATRPSVHGDVVHSRPIAVNYGTDAAPDLVVFYGGNDGILRAVNGNRTANFSHGSTKGAGSELWSFMPPEFYPKIQRIYDNTTKISFPGYTIDTPTPLPKIYGVDGPITAYKGASASWLYATMRRGGNAMYAFDVTAAASPTLKWRKTGTDLPNLGQTWAAPVIALSAGYGAGASPILVMGGGYDTCQDFDGNTNGCGTQGKNIFVLDANTGALLKTFATDSSVVADVAIVPDSAGLLKFIYAVDLGGSAYRISGADANTAIGATLPANWTITKIADFGGNATDNRKFMFAPDVIEDGSGYIVSMGSGDREKPLNNTVFPKANAVVNYYFSFRDRPTDATWLAGECSGANALCLSSLYPITTSATPTAEQLVTKKGWYLGLAATEQVVTSSITVFGTVTFSTHMPAVSVSGACTNNLGTATVYNINYKDASPISDTRGQVIAGGGLPPSPVAGIVILDDGTKTPFLIGGSAISPLQGSVPPAPAAVSRPKSRVYWNIKQ